MILSNRMCRVKLLLERVEDFLLISETFKGIPRPPVRVALRFPPRLEHGVPYCVTMGNFEPLELLSNFILLHPPQSPRNRKKGQPRFPPQFVTRPDFQQAAIERIERKMTGRRRHGLISGSGPSRHFAAMRKLIATGA